MLESTEEFDQQTPDPSGYFNKEAYCELADIPVHCQFALTLRREKCLYWLKPHIYADGTCLYGSAEIYRLASLSS